MGNIIQVARMIFSLLNKNGISPLNILQMAQRGATPDQVIQMLSGIFGNDPNFKRATEMAKGRSPEEMQNIVRNMCNESGLDFEGLKSTAGKFGIKL